jgi:hypothetical protein
VSDGAPMAVLDGGLEAAVHRYAVALGVRCPLWCRQHSFIPGAEAALLHHIVDLIDDDLGVYVIQADRISPDGRYLGREAANIGVCELPDHLTAEQATRLAGALAAAAHLVGAS